VTMLRSDRHLDAPYERAEGRVGRMFRPESEPYEHHRLRGHTTLGNEPHINSFVGQGGGYDLICKASASSKVFPSIRINRSTGNSSTHPIGYDPEWRTLGVVG